MVTFKRAETESELRQILNLQQANLPKSLTEEERKKEGFVTVEHDLSLLKRMNDRCAHFIAVSNNDVIGYALSMHSDFGDEIEVLVPMFSEIQNVVPSNETYIVMGQICIARDFRRKGIFRRLYEEMRKGLIPEYDKIITEVDSKNLHSLEAHLAIGFKRLENYESDGHIWELIYLD